MIKETRPNLATLFLHQSKVIDGINDTLKAHGVPDFVIDKVIKDAAILHDPHATPCCERLEK